MYLQLPHPQVIWKRLYDSESSMDGGTLHQLRNLINRVNVGKKAVKNQASEVEDFLELVINCHLLAAVMHFFGMSSTSDTPNRNEFPSEIDSMTPEQMGNILQDRMLKVIDQYVVPHEFVYTLEDNVPKQPMASSTIQNPHVASIRHDHSYTIQTQPSRRRYLPAFITGITSAPRSTIEVRRQVKDSVFDYGSAILNDGLLLLEFKDAIREGDGNRILSCWKALLLYFKAYNRTNYSREAFNLISAVYARTSERVSAQLKWSRVVNPTGKEGHNIPVDLFNEHINRTAKDYIRGHGANISESSIIQCGKSLEGMSAVISNFDHVNSVRAPSSQHTRASTLKDETLVLEELTKKSRVFDYIPGRLHGCSKLRRIEPNVANTIDKEKFVSWLSEQKQEMIKHSKLAKLFGHQPV